MYHSNKISDLESWSGIGSTLNATIRLRRELPHVLRKLEVQTILDIPCGDHHWMKEVDLSNTNYIGADLVKGVIVDAARKHTSPRKRFVQMDLLEDSLPKVDLILCRDLIVHLSINDALRAFRNIHASRSRWLMITTFPNILQNQNTHSGRWRPVNLCRDPFCFPKPDQFLDDQPSETVDPRYAKYIGLWPIAALPSFTL